MIDCGNRSSSLDFTERISSAVRLPRSSGRKCMRLWSISKVRREVREVRDWKQVLIVLPERLRYSREVRSPYRDRDITEDRGVSETAHREGGEDEELTRWSRSEGISH
jgi:hypothetical protein